MFENKLVYKLRPITTAFIFYLESILMIKRSANKKIHPGKWSGIGGQIEMHEFREPRAACIREIQEETGLKETDLSELKLRYIVFSKKKNEIWQQFVYIGNSKKKEISNNAEGELHWLSKKDVVNLIIPFTHHYILKHLFNNGVNEREILVGTSTIISGKKQVIWHSLESTI